MSDDHYEYDDQDVFDLEPEPAPQRNADGVTLRDGDVNPPDWLHEVFKRYEDYFDRVWDYSRYGKSSFDCVYTNRWVDKRTAKSYYPGRTREEYLDVWVNTKRAAPIIRSQHAEILMYVVECFPAAYRERWVPPGEISYHCPIPETSL